MGAAALGVTRRVRRALSAVFGGAVCTDTVSRVWREVKGDWDAWNARSLAEEPIVRVILDGTVVRVRLDRGRGRKSLRWSMLLPIP
jgi:putative transposase